MGKTFSSALARRYLCSGLIPLPSMLQIEISSLCNLRCVMCAKTLGYTGTPPDRLIEMDTVERLESVFPFLDYVDLSGVWGEAFVDPTLYLEILRRLKAHGITVRTITNATLISPAIAAAIVRYGLDILSISIDTASPETYRRIRRGAEIEDVLSAVRAIAEEKEAQRKGVPRTEFLVLGMRDTIEGLPDVVRMAAARGISRIVLQEMVDFEQVKGQSLAWGHRELGKRWYEKAAALGRELGVELELLPADQFEEPCETESHKTAAGRRRGAMLKDCFLPWKMPVVTTAGDVVPCCSLFDSMGNLREKSFEQIWRGERFRELRRALLSHQPPETCVVCSARGWREERGRREIREATVLLSVPVRRAFRRNPALRRLKPILKRALRL